MKKLLAKDMQSEDIVKQNIEKLKELFPEVFSEDKIKFEQLEELLGNHVNQDEDHYNFTWHGKKKAARLAQTPSTGTLRPAKDESVDFDNTQNLFIEGDNLEVLKLLQKSYHRKVKMIYIDPPYNTGNDFVYEDDFKDGVKHYLEMTGQTDESGKKLGTNSNSAGRYHTNWLNMMYPRLKLARNLLQDDGVIFISIDDNEQANLKKLCDEVFGEENFVELFILRSNPRGNQAKKITASEHDYLLCYAKVLKKISPMGFKKTDEEYNKEDNFGKYREMGLRKRGAGSRREDAPNQFYSIFYNPKNNNIDIKKRDEECIEIIPKLSNGDEGRWRWSYSSVLERKDELIIRQVKRDSGLEYDVFVKDYFSTDTISKIKSIIYEKHVNFETATREVASLFNMKKYFDYPKPIALLNMLSKISTNKNDLMLDFFAGSGTTAHAVMQLNAEDGGNRKCISVQLPELIDDTEKKKKDNAEAIKFLKSIHKPINIAEISKERIRRAAKKIKQENPDYQGDLGFKVFKLDSSNIKRWEAGFDSLKEDLLDAVDYIKNDRTNDDIVFEILLKYGLDLTLPIETRNIAGKKIYIIGLGALIICLDDGINMEVVNGICTLKEELSPEIMRVVFSDNGFKDDVIKTNAITTLKRSGIEDIKSL